MNTATPDERAELRRLGLVGERGPLGKKALEALAVMRGTAGLAEPVGPYDPAELAALITGLPAAGQAFARIGIAAVLVRQAGQQSHGHLGLIAVGATGTGKTTLARVLCAAFGLDPVTHRLVLNDQTRGAVVGRFAGSGKFTPATWRTRPFVLFDEADKSPALVREILTYFQGDLVSMIEGHPYPLRSVPMLAANGGPGIVPAEYRRRSVVLDTSGFDRAEVQRYVREHQHPGSAIVPLGLLQPAELDPATLPVLDQLTNRLNDAGRQEYPGAEYLGPLVLAYAAMLGIDQARAVAQLAADYLACAETVGHLPSADVEPVKTPEQIAAEEHAARLQRIALAGEIGQLRGRMRPYLTALEAALVNDWRTDQIERLRAQGAQVWRELDNAHTLAELEWPGGILARLVFDWIGAAGQVVNFPVREAIPEPEDSDDPDVIDSEAWEDSDEPEGSDDDEIPPADTPYLVSLGRLAFALFANR